MSFYTLGVIFRPVWLLGLRKCHGIVKEKLVDTIGIEID